MSNYHVSALVGEDNLTLLYQVEPGVCSKSFGIDVAKIAHFPEHVINDAKQRIAALEAGDGEDDDDEMSEGESLMEQYLNKIKQLEDMTDDDELEQRFAEIQKEILNSNKEMIKTLL